MARLMLTRLGHALFSMLALLLLVFGMVRLTGDPLQVLLPENATEEQHRQARQDLGLDDPVPVQFVTYIGNVAQGDLGDSIRLHTPVTELIGQRIPPTLAMASVALVAVLAIGVPLGVFAAYWRNGRFDRFVRPFAALGQSAPSFWVGLLLVLLFAVNLKWLPSGGYGGFDHLVLPAVTLAFGAVAGLTRLLRSSMIEVLNADYITFLRTKGLPERKILWKHGLRNGGLTALTFMGVLTASLFTGSVIAETVFVWPGLGRLMIEAVNYRDFPVIQGVMLLFSAVYIVMNLIVDLLYIVLNPRLR